MTLQLPVVPAPGLSQRARPYTQQTAHLLMQQLVQFGLPAAWRASAVDPFPTIPAALAHAVLELAADSGAHTALFIAKPIARPRKQLFTARNYPLTTLRRPPFSQVGHTVKRRLRVNRGLARYHHQGRLMVRAVRTTEEVPAETEQFITLGMLGEAQRAGRSVVGIVGAVHSAGRLTLLVPIAASVAGVTWQRVVVSPRQHFRVRSTDRVLFLPLPPTEPPGAEASEPEEER